MPRDALLVAASARIAFRSPAMCGSDTARPLVALAAAAAAAAAALSSGEGGMGRPPGSWRKICGGPKSATKPPFKRLQPSLAAACFCFCLCPCPWLGGEEEGGEGDEEEGKDGRRPAAAGREERKPVGS